MRPVITILETLWGGWPPQDGSFRSITQGRFLFRYRRRDTLSECKVFIKHPDGEAMLIYEEFEIHTSPFLGPQQMGSTVRGAWSGAFVEAVDLLYAKHEAEQRAEQSRRRAAEKAQRAKMEALFEEKVTA